MNVFDASALIAFLSAEPGSEVVERELVAGDACSAVSWSETAQRTLARDRDWQPARGLLLSYGLVASRSRPSTPRARLRSGGQAPRCPPRTGSVWRQRIGSTPPC